MKFLCSCNISKPIGTLILVVLLCTGWILGNLIHGITEDNQLHEIYTEEPIDK